jgi:NAD+ kinase
MSPFDTVVLLGQLDDPRVREAVDGLAEFLRRRGRQAILEQDLSAGNLARVQLAIVVGGDGTLLHAARSMAPHGVPLIGVNLGRLGFLTDVPLARVEGDIGRILDGDYVTQERMMLAIEVRRGDAVGESRLAFNDVVVGKSAVERLIEVRVHVDGEFVTAVRSDGLIVATPTGSTAYALSAGGPILHPTLEALIVVPICPHTLSQRPIALHAGSVIELVPSEQSAADAHVALDGRIVADLAVGDTVRVRRAERTVKLIRLPDHSDFEALRSKLGWGDRF